MLAIHRFTSTHKAAETLLQQFSLALGHLEKDGLIVVASIFVDARPHGLQTLTEGSTAPMLPTLLRPELLHSDTDPFLEVLLDPRLIADNHPLRDKKNVS